MRKLRFAILAALFSLTYLTNVGLAQSGKSELIIVHLNTLQEDLDDYVDAGTIDKSEAIEVRRLVDGYSSKNRVKKIGKYALVGSGTVTAAVASWAAALLGYVHYCRLLGGYDLFARYVTAVTLAGFGAGGMAAFFGLKKLLFRAKDNRVKIRLTPSDDDNETRTISLI